MSLARTRRLRRLRQKPHSAGRPGLVFALLLVPFAIAGVVAAIGIAIGATTYVDSVTGELPTPQEAIAERGGGTRIYDRNGVLLYEFLDDRYGRQETVPLDRISPLIQDATIAAEDASFYDNPGVNPRGLARAAVENFKPGDEFLQGTGGSSITQQLVKQLYFTQEERQERSVARKVREAVIALELTRKYSKQQILEWYLNEIPYGGLMRGVQAASEGYFGIPASDVTLGQAAFLAGLPQSPGEYDPFSNMPAALERQHEVLDLMAKHGFISQELANWAKLEQIVLSPAPQPFLAPHFVLYVGEYIKQTLGEEALYHGGLDVLTTLDLGLQTRANEILEKHLRTYEKSSNGHNGSVVIIEPPTGRILAMVGSRDYFRADVNGEVNNALALNSPGSTLKPFTYATAFMQGWSPDWPIVDTPITYREEGGTAFSPRNPDGRTRGVMPVKQALGNSFNIPAFKTILWVGVDNMVKTAKSMGITTLDRQLGPSITLGGVDVKLLDMVYGYGTFANNGVMAGAPATGALPAGNRSLDPISVLLVKDRRGDVLIDNTTPETDYVIDPEYAYMITDVLSADENRQITYGRGGKLNIPGWRVAVKTGTSEPYEKSRLIGDTWTFGYTPDVAVGVWVGNSDNSPMTNILSTTIAGSTWHDSMVAALEGRTKRDWVRPDGLVQATVCVPSGRLAEGQSCPSVTGTFARQAIEKARAADWWGGQTVAANNVGNGVPAEVTGWKRALAEEYLRSYRRSAVPPQRASAPAPAAPAPVAPRPAAVPPGDDPRNVPDGARQNGNGRGRGREQ